MFEKFWRDNLKEIQENKIRFTAICVIFVFAVILFLSDDGGEEIILTENSPPEIAEKVDADTNIVAVKRAEISNADGNIKIVIGANSEDLFVHDPFQVPPKEIQPPPEIPPEIPPVIPPVIIPQPVAQVSIPTEKFILRGTVIIGENKSALVQKISANDKNSEADNLILNIGDNLNGKKIVDIAQDFLMLEGGEILYLDIQTP